MDVTQEERLLVNLARTMDLLAKISQKSDTLESIKNIDTIAEKVDSDAKEKS